MRKCMLIHVTFVLEIHITDITTKTWFNFVCRSMVFELCFPCERLLTFQAMVWFLSCMYSHMLLQVTLVTEWFFTHRTLESTFTCMHDTVTLQVVFWTEAFHTRWALEGFTPSTCACVLFHICSLSEEHSTCWTATCAALFRFWRFLCYFTIIKRIMSIYQEYTRRFL